MPIGKFVFFWSIRERRECRIFKYNIVLEDCFAVLLQLKFEVILISRVVLYLNGFDISDPLYIVLEYLPHGDLLGYLRKSRGHEDTYNTGEKRPSSKLTEKDLLSFAWMIADGMSYLATMKVNHKTGRIHHHFS